jgi:hypothetical protein
LENVNIFPYFFIDIFGAARTAPAAAQIHARPR